MKTVNVFSVTLIQNVSKCLYIYIYIYLLLLYLRIHLELHGYSKNKNISYIINI